MADSCTGWQGGGGQAVTWDGGGHAVAEGGRQVAGEGPQCISQWHSVAVVAGERVAGAVSGGGGRQFEGGAVAGWRQAVAEDGRQLQGEGWQGVRVN